MLTVSAVYRKESISLLTVSLVGGVQEQLVPLPALIMINSKDCLDNCKEMFAFLVAILFCCISIGNLTFG